MQAGPFLTFQLDRGQSAADAMHRYVELFDDGEIVLEQRRGPGEPGEGSIMMAEFVAAGLRFRCSDSVIRHDWDLSPAASVWVDCSSEAEQRRLFDGLVDGGTAHMPLDDYGFGPFGWVQDRFGLNWQLFRSPVQD